MGMNISENFTDIINGTNIHMTSGHSSHLANPERIKNLDISIANILIRSFAVAIACTGMLCNFFVLKSLMAVRQEQLKSRFFILNMVFADFLLPPFSSSDLIMPILYGYGITGDYVHRCITVLSAAFISFALYYQCLASLVLACDRLYAILAPLKYYTFGYPRWLLVCVVGSTWVIPLSLISPVFIMPFITPLKVAGSGICYKLFAGHRAWGTVVRTGILLSIGIVTFCIYILLFLLVKILRRTNVAAKGVQSTDRKSAVSQAVTYFVVHCMSLVFFLPRPIFSELLPRSNSQLDKAAHDLIRRSLVLIYYLNSIIDPIILSLRIPAIKQKLYLNLGFKLLQPLSKGDRIAEPSTKQVSTIAIA